MRSEMFQELFESTQWGILVVDHSGRLTALNTAAKTLLELDSGFPLQGPCEEVLSRHPLLVHLLKDALKAHDPPGQFEIALQDAQIRKRVIGGWVCPIRDQEEIGRGIAIVFWDATRLEHDEERERLMERLAALGEMAAGLAHEIRNPLGNIGSTAMVLKRKLRGDDSGIFALNNIISEVKRLNTTVTHCLEYAKPVHLKLRKVEIPPLVKDALQDVVAMWPHHEVSVV